MEGCVLAGKEGLSRRDERFCRLYANYRDPERAGTEAGLPPERCRRLLEDARALRKIEEQMEIRRRQAAQQSLAQGLEGGGSPSRLGLALLTAGVMALGTALGGKPIVEKVGTELASLSPAEGLAADLGAGVVLLVCSALGLPVSTTHAKVAAVCGAGRGASRAVMVQMAGAWILTFPACGGIAFLLARIMQG